VSASGLTDAPARLAATRPAEARGIARDGVRLMVSDASAHEVEHALFRDLPRFLEPGDLLVVNASATLPAALAAWWTAGRRAGEALELHLSTPLAGGSSSQWVV
jgi:S-adenosylmethionine:tRNA ribosyltransferase-isomerase